MPDKIHLLPDSVANQIAAGEVIQRPASVIKELVENAVDAGADNIRIFIKDAGRTLIQVIDNGHGMSDTDARMAFERHATSKISSAADLSSLTTMGFRGEALPSICAISQVEIRTRLRNSPVGTHLVISGSRVEQQEPDICEFGTNIMVKNLFFNVPARRKFLKSDSVELSNILREFERLALVNPGVQISIDTGAKEINLRKSTMLQRIGDIWKGNIVQQLIPISADTPSVKISGFISRPEFARRRNALQYFLVNGRNMRHAYFRKAVLNCYNGLIAPDTLPCYFIKFDIDPASIDVNIHPTKDEIKFEEENVIWSILSAAVRASLGKNAAVPSIDFDSDVLPVETTGSQSERSASFPTFDIPQDYNPFASATSQQTPKRKDTDSQAWRDNNPKPITDWDKLYEGFMSKKSSTVHAPNQGTDILPETEPVSVSFGGSSFQFDEKYIIACLEGKGVAIIDQHRAHVKILYEQMMKRLISKQSASQTLLFPALLELSPEQEIILDEAHGILSSLGMQIEKEGLDYVITGVPPGVSTDSGVEITIRVLETLMDDASHHGLESSEDIAESLKRKVVISMARSMAVKRGRILSEEERNEIITSLFQLPDPSLTPTGRRIYTLFGTSAIEKLLP